MYNRVYIVFCRGVEDRRVGEENVLLANLDGAQLPGHNLWLVAN